MESFRALLVVDAEDFGGHRDATLRHLHLEIRRALGAAFEASGLGDAWRSAPVLESTGDGFLVVLPHAAAARLVEPFPRRLQDALAAAAPGLRARGARLRLRAALHVGLVDDGRPDAPGVCTATIEANRLLDGEPLRAALSRSDPEVTLAAFLLSAEMFAIYVEGGRTGLRESQFTPVTVEVKRYQRPAHLYVPTPSRAPGPAAPGPAGAGSAGAVPGAGARPAGPAEAPPAPAPRPGSAPSFGNITIKGDDAQNAFGNTGDVRQERR